MRIGIDASGAAKEKRTGIGRYIASLVDALLRGSTGDEIVLAVRFSRLRRRRWFLRAPGARVRLFQEPFTGWMRRGLDVFHGPDLRIPRARVPLVATIHDAFSVTSDAFARESFRKERAAIYADTASRAAAVITVSRASRDRLCEALGIPAERVHVVHLGVDGRFRPQDPETIDAVRRRHGLPARYLVHVGQVSRRKNLPRLIEAFGAISGDRPDLHLVLAGRLSYGAEETVAAREASPARDRIRLTDHFPDEDLPGLYAGAEAAVLASLDEGFGLPVVEAMACGTPVVASTSGALPEVTDGAAVLVDAEDVDEIASGLARAIEDEALRSDLVERGLTRAAALGWDGCAEATRAVYRRVVGA